MAGRIGKAQARWEGWMCFSEGCAKGPNRGIVAAMLPPQLGTTRTMGRATGALVTLWLFAGGWLAGALAVASAAELSVNARFPGGNIVVEKIERDTVWLRQDLRDTAQFWFYWLFEVRGVAGRTVEFRFTNGNVFGTRGPAISRDGGRTWGWLGTNACRGQSFVHAFA